MADTYPRKNQNVDLGKAVMLAVANTYDGGTPSTADSAYVGVALDGGSSG